MKPLQTTQLPCDAAPSQWCGALSTALLLGRPLRAGNDALLPHCHHHLHNQNISKQQVYTTPDERYGSSERESENQHEIGQAASALTGTSVLQ